MELFRAALHAFALAASIACAFLLFREYRRTHYRLLLWSALCFAGLTLNNLLLFADVVVLPAVDLRAWRLLAALAAIGCMLYALTMESD